MLYEVITITDSIDSITSAVATLVWEVAVEKLDGGVITSYSIHYTKLYVGCPLVWFTQARNRRLISAAVLCTKLRSSEWRSRRARRASHRGAQDAHAIISNDTG